VGVYGNFVYGGGKYGATPKLAYSVEPMSITVLDYDRTLVEWQSPTGDFTRWRLVRSQTGYPENEEDGVIVYEEFATEGNVTRVSFVDSDDAEEPIIGIDPGRQIYYRFFLQSIGLLLDKSPIQFLQTMMLKKNLWTLFQKFTLVKSKVL
jgi:hypothetical protein